MSSHCDYRGRVLKCTIVDSNTGVKGRGFAEDFILYLKKKMLSVCTMMWHPDAGYRVTFYIQGNNDQLTAAGSYGRRRYNRIVKGKGEITPFTTCSRPYYCVKLSGDCYDQSLSTCAPADFTLKLHATYVSNPIENPVTGVKKPVVPYELCSDSDNDDAYSPSMLNH